MTSNDEGVWRRPTLEVGRLLDGAVRLAAATALPLWPIWVACLAIQALGALWVRANMGADFRLSPEQVLVLSAADAIPSAVILGVAVRAMLGVGRERWRLDRGLAGYGLISLAMLLVEILPASLMAEAASGVADPYWRQWGLYLPGPIMWFAVLYPTSRLMPWPVRHLMGETSATPAQSWAAMRGATGPVMLAVIATSAPFYIADGFAWERFYYFDSDWGLAAGSAIDVAWSAVACALTATIYRTLFVEPERLSEVFA